MLSPCLYWPDIFHLATALNDLCILDIFTLVPSDVIYYFNYLTQNYYSHLLTAGK